MEQTGNKMLYRGTSHWQICKNPCGAPHYFYPPNLSLSLNHPNTENKKIYTKQKLYEHTAMAENCDLLYLRK